MPAKTRNGLKRISIRHVAEAAGVGTTTVSDIVNRNLVDKYPIETRDKVLRAMKSVGYTPNRAAQKLRGTRSREIGVVITREFNNPFFARLAHEIQSNLTRHGYRVQLIVVGHDMFSLARFPLELLSDDVDGVLLGPVYSTDRRHLDALQAFEEVNMPVMLFGGTCATNFLEYHWPHGQAGQLAADILLDRGHSRIAFLGSDDGTLGCDEGKSSSAAAAIARAGFTMERISHADTGDYDDFYQTAASFGRTWKQQPEEQRASAVICLNDQMAIAALAAWSDLDIRVPQDLSVVGFDNLPEAKVIRPALSTIDFRTAQQVEQLTHLFVKHLEGEHLNDEAKRLDPVTPIPIVRDSVKTLIDHQREPVSINDRPA